MTGNIALDVFIGLIFIYLLYSLYATIIIELLSSLFRYRALNLKYALNRMLTDSRKPETIYLIESGAMDLVVKKGKNLLERFYEQPTVKYLAKRGWLGNRKPSYISPQNFSKALIESLKEIGTGESVIEKVMSALHGDEINKETRKHLISLLEDANNDLQKFRILLENWFDDTMERVIGWYKKRVQIALLIVGFVLAVVFNVNTLDIGKSLARNSKAREQLVELSTNYLKENNELIELITGTGQDSVPTGRQPESTSSQEGTTGTTTKEALKVKIDSLNVIKYQLEDDIANAQSLFGGGWNIPDSLAFIIGGYQFKCNTANTATGTSNVAGEKTKIGKNKFIKTVKIEIENQTSSYAALVSIPYKYNKNIKVLKRAIAGTYHVESCPETSVNGYLHVSKAKYKWTYFYRHIWGYLLTALAISLGAPFWFDLLNKLIQIRGSARQETATQKSRKAVRQSGDDPDNPLNRKG